MTGDVPEENVACAEERNIFPAPKRRQRIREAHRLAILVLDVMCFGFGIVWCRARLCGNGAVVDAHSW